MNMRLTFSGIAAVALLSACGDEGAVAPVGGAAYETTFITVAAPRYPTMRANTYGRTVNNAAVVDSIVGEVALMKPLDGRARYQFYLVNGLDSSATPVSHRQWIIRTDTVLDANGALTLPVDTNRSAGVRDFWRGEFFGRKLRFAVSLTASDSAQQRGAWLVLTIQSDSARTTYNDSTPRPLFVRFRDQKGTVTRDDDAIAPDTLRGNFGEFLSPARQTRYVNGGAGSLLFWDVSKTGKPAMRVDFSNLPKPPRGYFYQSFIIDTVSGIAYAWGTSYTGVNTVLGSSDLGKDSIIANLKAVQTPDDVIGLAQNYTRVDLVLETKTAPPLLRTGLAIYSAMSVQRAAIPAALAAKRSALGTVNVIVTKGAQGGPVAPNVGIVVQGPGFNFNQLIGNKNTDATGTATFAGMPVGEIRVIAIPFGGSIVDSRATITSGQTTTVRLVVP
jgi:hypothetical protein